MTACCKVYQAPVLGVLGVQVACDVSHILAAYFCVQIQQATLPEDSKQRLVIAATYNDLRFADVPALADILAQNPQVTILAFENHFTVSDLRMLHRRNATLTRCAPPTG